MGHTRVGWQTTHSLPPKHPQSEKNGETGLMVVLGSECVRGLLTPVEGGSVTLATEFDYPVGRGADRAEIEPRQR